MTRHEGGGSFRPPPPHHYRPSPPPPQHHRPPPAPFFPPPPHRRPIPTFHVPPPMFYSGTPLGGPVFPMPPTEVVQPISRREQLLNRSKAIFTFTVIALLVGTIWLYCGTYESEVIQLGVHDSRLITARSFFVKSIKFENRHGNEGPLLYVFDHKPPLNEALSWVDTQNATLSGSVFRPVHREFYYWMNKGSTVTLNYVLKASRKHQPVYLAMVRDTAEDLQDYFDRPSALSDPLQVHGVLKYEADKDAHYVFSLLTYNPEDVKVNLEFQFHSREYSTDGAIQEGRLKTDSKIYLSFFQSRYGVLQGPGYNKMAVDEWEIEISYGIRWTAIVLIFGIVTLVYLVTKSMIMKSVQERDPSFPEHAPLLRPQETQATVPGPAPAAAPSAPSAPILPDSILEEAESGNLKDKEKDTGEDVLEDKLCSVCLDAAKNCFFVPCGHRATCYACGLRISQLDPANCPICREPIGEVKRIYDA